MWFPRCPFCPILLWVQEAFPRYQCIVWHKQCYKINSFRNWNPRAFHYCCSVIPTSVINSPRALIFSGDRPGFTSSMTNLYVPFIGIWLSMNRWLNSLKCSSRPRQFFAALADYLGYFSAVLIRLSISSYHDKMIIAVPHAPSITKLTKRSRALQNRTQDDLARRMRYTFLFERSFPGQTRARWGGRWARGKS